MANTFTNPIVLDTFTAAIDITPASLGNAYKPIKIDSIEFVRPAATTNTCTITDQNDINIFSERCIVATQSIIKYYGGMPVGGIKIAVAGGNHMAAGSISIVLSED